MIVEPGLAPVGVPACLSRVMVDVRVMARVAELVADTVTLVGDVPDAVAVLLTEPASTSACVSV